MFYKFYGKVSVQASTSSYITKTPPGTLRSNNIFLRLSPAPRYLQKEVDIPIKENIPDDAVVKNKS